MTDSKDDQTDSKDGQEDRSDFLPILRLVITITGVVSLTLAVIMLVSGGKLYEEALKTSLQFFLVTCLGGALVALLTWSREQDAKRDAKRTARKASSAARVTALQEIDRELGDSYRALKTVKRQLRAQLVDAIRDENGKPSAPYGFRAEDFRKSMADLLAAQIAAEHVRERVAVLSDLFNKAQRERLRDWLHYATRYFQDVLEDLEYGKVRFEGDTCWVDALCCNIDDFLDDDLDALLEGPTIPPLPATVKAVLRLYNEQKENDADRQHLLLGLVTTIRKKDPKKRRFGKIARDCFDCASLEVRVLIAKETNPAKSASHQKKPFLARIFGWIPRPLFFQPKSEGSSAS